MKIDLRSIYRFQPIEYSGALPSGGDVYYECECGDIVSDRRQNGRLHRNA